MYDPNSIFLIEDTPKWVNAFFIREEKHFLGSYGFKQSYERSETWKTLFSNMKNEFTNFWRIWDKNVIFDLAKFILASL